MTTPTPAELRAAAAHLAKVKAAPDQHGHNHVKDAIQALSVESREGDALSNISGWRDWYCNGPEGAESLAWLTEAARWRLLLTALWQEQEARRQSGVRICADCADGLGADAADWMCGCDDEAIVKLVRELLAGTSPVPAG